MKTSFTLLLVLLCLCSGTQSAQSQYITNGSFSYFTQPPCLKVRTPTWKSTTATVPYDYVRDANTGWKKATIGTPDYFNTYYAGVTCASKELNVPGSLPLYTSGEYTSNNFAGYQYDATPGTGGYGGYVGIDIGSFHKREDNTTTQYREYITQQLQQPLLKDVAYKVSYKVSLAERYSTPSLPSALRIGAFFTPVDPTNLTHWEMLKDPLTLGYAAPQIVGVPASPYTNLNNTQNWILIEGIIIPDQDMNWITIGNFQPSVIRDMYPEGWVDYYFYIDDVDIIQVLPEACSCLFEVGQPKRISRDPCCYEFTITSETGACKLDKIVIQDMSNSSFKTEKIFPYGFSPGSTTTMNYCLTNDQNISIDESNVEIIFYAKDVQGNYIEICRRNASNTSGLRCESPCVLPDHDQSKWSISRSPDNECCWELKLTLDKDDYDITDIGGFSLEVTNGSINDLSFSTSPPYWDTAPNSNDIHFINPALNNNALEHNQTYVIGKFCLDAGNSRSISITPIDAQGNKKKDCPSLTKTISCPANCCDALDMQLVGLDQVQEDYPCTSKLYIFNNDGSTCKAQKVTITINGNTTVYTPVPGLSYFSFKEGPVTPGSAPFTVLYLGATAHNITITVEIKDANGNIIQCTKTFTLDCTPQGGGGTNKQGTQGNVESESDIINGSCLKWTDNSTVTIAADCITGTTKNVRVVDAMGRAVDAPHRYDAASNSFIVELGTLSSGAYFIHVSSSEQSVAYPVLWTK